ncbi:MAG: hypothetical protein D6820_11465 [Lentisphaerae bacterium]|nr:MAG: hypothetical protein D6820_11465 [Lentisphaerota bacterium]
MRTLATLIGWTILGLFCAIGLRTSWSWLRNKSPETAEQIQQRTRQIAQAASKHVDSLRHSPTPSSSKQQATGEGLEPEKQVVQSGSSERVEAARSSAANTVSQQNAVRQQATDRGATVSQAPNAGATPSRPVQTPDSADTSDPIERLNRLAQQSASPQQQSHSAPLTGHSAETDDVSLKRQEDSVIKRQLRLVEELTQP